MSRKTLLPLVLAALLCMPAAESAELIAVGRLSGQGRDLSAATAAKLENGLPGNLLGGLGSGLAYAGGNTFIAVPDRGPNATPYNALVDNSTSYVTRFHTLTMALTPNAATADLPFTLTPVLTATTLLSSPTPLIYGSGSAYALASGHPAFNDATHYYFTGRSDNVEAGKSSANPRNGRFDPEAVRVSPDGKTVFVSDEYGPNLYRFERASGKRVAVYALPEKFAIALPAANEQMETEANSSGRAPNKGMEGLAITPDGKLLVGIMQANLSQDAKGLLRIVTIAVDTGATHEYAYRLSSGSGVSEIVALNDHQFLVDERDGKGAGDGSKAVVKQVFMIDLAGASDVGKVAKLGAGAPVLRKSLLLDLVALLKAKGYDARQIPAKIEGMAFGADVNIKGVPHHTLYIANDNDFLAEYGDNQFFVFGVSDADLAAIGATYQAQALPPAPGPDT